MYVLRHQIIEFHLVYFVTCENDFETESKRLTRRLNVSQVFTLLLQMLLLNPLLKRLAQVSKNYFQ